jgi:uncharacterized membrane protein (DUF2068 family)
MTSSKQLAPTFYLIIAFKFFKAALLLSLAVGVFRLKDRNLPDFFLATLHWAHLDVKTAFVTHTVERLQRVTPEGLKWIARGSMLSGLLHLTEAIVLCLRQPWGGWLAIIQSSLFVPIEVYELSKKFSYGMLSMMIINIIVVVYLYRNRRLFSHHGAAPSAQPAKNKKPPQ